MTTSHRPTFAPALGGAPIAISTSISSKDGNLQPIKLRESMPSADRDLKAELFRREQLASGKKTGARGAEDDEDDEVTSLVASSVASSSKRARKEDNPDADDTDDDSEDSADDADSGDDNADDDDDDDDEDDTEALMRELEKIRREREEEAARQSRLEEDDAERQRAEQALRSNPLVSGGDFSIKKKWYDDTVFKNCAKKEDTQKRFINDTTRSDFHRKFLGRFIK